MTLSLNEEFSSSMEFAIDFEQWYFLAISYDGSVTGVSAGLSTAVRQTARAAA